eukprot:g3523.t1
MDPSAALQPYPLFGRRPRPEAPPANEGTSKSAPRASDSPILVASTSANKQYANGQRLMPAVNHLRKLLECRGEDANVPSASATNTLGSPGANSSAASFRAPASPGGVAVPSPTSGSAAVARRRSSSHKEQIENTNAKLDGETFSDASAVSKDRSHQPLSGSRSGSPLGTNNTSPSTYGQAAATSSGSASRGQSPSMSTTSSSAFTSAAGSLSFTPAISHDSSFMTLSGGEINFKRNIDTFRAERSNRHKSNARRNAANRTGGSDSSDNSDASANSAQHQSSKRRVISPVALNLDAVTPSTAVPNRASPEDGDDVPSAPSARLRPLFPSDNNGPSDLDDNSASTPEAKQDNDDSHVEMAIDGLSPGTQAAIEAASAAEQLEARAQSALPSSGAAAAASSAQGSSSQVDDDMAASIALARQLMYEESMQAAQWIQRETLAAHRQQQLELANRGLSGNGEGGQVDEDLLMALELAEQEQHAAEHAIPDDQDFDVEEMSYDQLMDLSSRIGSVAQQRWQLDSRNIVSALPTKELTDKDIADRAAAKKNQKTSSLALIVEDPTICQVCQCDFEAGDHVRVLPCGHDFHVGCIDHWLKDNNSCVLCKAPVDKPANAPPAGESQSDGAAEGAKRDE